MAVGVTAGSPTAAHIKGVRGDLMDIPMLYEDRQGVPGPRRLAEKKLRTAKKYSSSAKAVPIRRTGGSALSWRCQP
jgi:hypothetical protein